MTIDEMATAAGRVISMHLAKAGAKAIESAVNGLRALQPVFFLVLQFSLFFRIRVYLNDALLGDTWFRYQHSDRFFWLTVEMLPFIFTGVVAWLYPRFFRPVMPISPALLFVLPSIIGLMWHQTYAWAHSYPRGGPTTEYRIQDKTGCVTSNGAIVMNAIYDDVKCIGFDEPLAWAHLVDNDGEDYIPVKVSRKWGLLDRSRKMVIKPQFEDVFHEATWGLRPAKKAGKWGFIHSLSGTPAIPFEYDEVGPFRFGEGMASPWAPAAKNGRWGYIDRLNRVRIPFQFDDAEAFWSSNLYELQDRARRADKLSWWRTFLMTITEPVSGSPAWNKVRVGKLWGVIDSTGRFILPPSIPSEYESFLRCDTRTPQCFWHENLGTEDRILLSATTNWTCRTLRPYWPSFLSECEPAR
jgi:WG containing repeat